MIEIEERCAALLRQLRKKKGLTLRQCEEASGGRFKAVVMGSYERGTRAISLERLQEIADFYEVPIQYFFVDGKTPQSGTAPHLTFDLRKIRSAPYLEDGVTRIAALLALFVKKRSDWNGEVLTIRRSDGDLLPIIANDDDILEKLELDGIFFKTRS